MVPPKKGFGISWPSWTASDEESTPLHRLSGRCQAHLFDMVILFYDIDLAIMREIQLDREFHKEGNNEKKNYMLRTCSLFNEDCPNLQPFEQSIKLRAITGHTIHDLEIGTLIDTTFNNIWGLAATSLLEFQGPVEEYMDSGFVECVTHAMARERARVVLDIRSTILDIFEGIEDELVQQNLGYIWSGIRSRLRSLDGFEAVYNNYIGQMRCNLDNKLTPYTRPSERRKKHRSVSVAYQQDRQNRNATIIAVVFATTIIGFIPMIFAWHRATDLPGSVQDVDFWLLLQTAIMQLLGLFTAMFPIYRHAKSHAWRWAQAFTALRASCSLISIPLYLYAPTMWSALLSFFSSAAQVGMTILIALMADIVTLPLKEE